MLNNNKNRLTVSWALLTASMNLLLSDKRILWVPAVAVVLSLVLGAVFAVPVVLDLVRWAEQSQMQHTPVGLIVMLVIYYVLLYFISTFAGAMVISHINRKLTKQNTALGLAFRDAWQRVGALFLWSVLAASIGMLLQNLERSHRSIASIIAGLFLGLAWGVISFFALPIIVIDQVGVLDGIKEAMSVIRKQWGSMVLGMGVAGLLFLLLTLVGIAAIVAAFKYSHSAELTLIISIVAILYMVMVGIVRATVYMVFRTLLLHYAKTGKLSAEMS